LVVFPLVYHLWVKPNILQRGRFGWKSIRFFQAQFPSNYIRDRCERCIETSDSCKNFIDSSSPDKDNIWLNDIWRGVIKKSFPDRFEETFRRGYTCKLVLGLDLTLGFFFVLGVLTVLGRILYVYGFEPQADWGFESLHFLYPAVCIGVVALNRFLNKPDMENPTGCWHAWREENNGHIRWLRNNEQLLVDIVCHAGGNSKHFQEIAQ